MNSDKVAVAGQRRTRRKSVAVTKEKIINSVYNQVGLSKSQSRQVVESLLELVKKALENGEDLLISGFGKFVVKSKAARRGRNPQTTQDLQLRARKVVVFKTSGVLRNKMNAAAVPFKDQS